MTTVPVPMTESLAPPTPLTLHEPASSGVKWRKDDLESVMCSEAPESAIQRPDLSALKHADEIKASLSLKETFFGAVDLLLDCCSWPAFSSLALYLQLVAV